MLSWQIGLVAKESVNLLEEIQSQKSKAAANFKNYKESGNTQYKSLIDNGFWNFIYFT